MIRKTFVRSFFAVSSFIVADLVHAKRIQINCLTKHKHQYGVQPNCVGQKMFSELQFIALHATNEEEEIRLV